MHNDHLHQRRGDKPQERAPRPRPAEAGTEDGNASGFDEAYYQSGYRDAPYFSSGRNWRDYAPAYRYGHAARANHRDQRFDDVEAELATHWDTVKADSRLLWAEARYAVRDAWLHFDAGFQAGCARGRHD